VLNVALNTGNPNLQSSLLNKTDRHDKTEILFKVAFSTITLTPSCDVIKIKIVLVASRGLRSVSPEEEAEWSKED
jgi:hypothetical protein